MVKGYRNFTKK